MRLFRHAVIVALAALALAGCAVVKDQLAISNVNGCIKHNCTNQDAQAYTSCEAACRSTYGR